MLIKKPLFYATFYSLLVFIFSLYIVPLYIDGDQLHYRDFYKYCLYENLTPLQQFFCYEITLGTKEPGYFYISKIAYPYLDKDMYITLANTALTFVMTLAIFKYYKLVWHRHVFLILILMNYYFIVMLTSAERLKFSFIFLALALLINSNKRIIIFGLALLTHVQTILLLAPYYIGQFFDKSESKFLKILMILGFVAVSGATFFVLQEHIESKFTSYSNSVDEDGLGVMGSLKTSVFIILALVTTRRLLPLICGLPLIVMAFFLGSDRIGMLAFILYAGVVIYYKRRMDVVLFIVMIYFVYKSSEFISNILEYGTGYHFIN